LLQYKAWTAAKALVGSSAAGRKRLETPAVAVLTKSILMEAVHMADAAIPLLNLVILGSFMAFGIRELAQVSERVTVEADSSEKR
jgi:hydrogenase/urease accessory protein HupE